MILRFLGTGTSFGVPVVGCDCAACTSDDARDRRTRHAALIEDKGRRVLVDTPPELRLQLLAAGVDRVDAVWYTHCHADHTHGADDLRVFSGRYRKPVQAYASEACAAELSDRLRYVFDPSAEPLVGVSRPDVRLHTFRAHQPVNIAGFTMLPLPVPHGSQEAFGFRAGELGYITDAKRLPGRTRVALEGVRVLVLNALWSEKSRAPHPTHFTLEEAVTVAGQVGAGRTYLTHLSHRVRHAETEEWLPEGVYLAYDGLVVEV
ncbi:MAG: MBL fold metallo-hydrolase [Longimicrobiaceae bacterium]